MNPERSNSGSSRAAVARLLARAGLIGRGHTGATLQMQEPDRQRMAMDPPRMVNSILVGGFNPSEKYEFVSWDDYSQYMETSKNVPNHQPVWLILWLSLWLVDGSLDWWENLKETLCFCLFSSEICGSVLLIMGSNHGES